ncbi:MAG: TonB-dependent receptor [Saprospiraceae bacterium]
MMRSFLLFLTTFISISFALAQEATLFGIIRDIDSNQGIDYVTVNLDGTSVVDESDLSGQYSIKIPANTKVKIIFSRIGYSDFILELNSISAGMNRNINVKMVPKALDLEITVKAGKIDDVGNVREEVTELKLLPNASGNFESVLPSIALGVSTGSGGELSSQYNVRGGNYDENLVYVNDFEIFRPQLIRGGQQEGLSFPNIDLIRDLEFSSGGFESKYGDKMASVLDIRYKRPEEFRASVGASLLGASAQIEGSKRMGPNAYNKFRYLIGARYKSNAYLLGSRDIKGEYVPVFSDIQTYLSYDLTKVLQLGLIANFNRSAYHFIPSSGRSKSGNFAFQIELNTSFEGQEKDEFTYGMTGLSLTYVPENRKNPLYMKWLVSAYRANEDEKFDIIGQYRLSQIEANIGESTGEEVAVLGSGTQHLNARNFLFNTVYNAEYKGGLEINKPKLGNTVTGHFIQWSLKYQHEFFEDFLKEWERLDSADYNIPYSGENIELQNVIRSNNTIQNHKLTAYIQNTFRYENTGHEWKITLGSRFSYHHLSSEFITSPRLQVLYKPLRWNKDIAFKLAGGYYVQPPFYREMRRPDGTVNTNLLSQKSVHLVGGLAYDFIWEAVSNRPFKIISEIYYKRLEDLVSYEIDNVRIRYAGENNATGYITGIDFRINGEFVKGAESWVNFSFLRARESINGIQHKELTIIDSMLVATNVADAPRPTDQLFTVNMFFQDYLPRNENVKVNLNFSLGSGLPFGPRQDNLEFRNVFRLKAYRRVDIGFSFQLWKEEWISRKPNHFLRFTRSTWLSIEAFNLLNIKNQASVTWIKTLTNVEYSLPNNLTGRRINVRFKIDF